MVLNKRYMGRYDKQPPDRDQRSFSIETWITKSEEFLTIENAVYMPEDPAEQKSSSMNIYVVGKTTRYGT